jgi:hypothetical protein
MTYPKENLLRGSSPLFAMAIALTVCMLGGAKAEDSGGNAGTKNNEEVERCVETLREAPATSAPELYYNGRSIAAYQRDKFITVFDVSRDDSELFKGCIDKTGMSSVIMERDLGPDYLYLRLEGEPSNIPQGIKYLYTNQYQKHYLLDLENARLYELVRIPPPGSTEAIGTWTGTVTKGPGCKNSYGDSCGTKYEKNGAGGYDRVR